MVLRSRARETRAWSSAIIIIIIIIIIVISFWGLIHLGFQRHPGNKPQYYVASCLIVSHTTTRPFFYIYRCKRKWESQLGFILSYKVISSFIRPSVSVCPSTKPLRPCFHCTFRIQFYDWVTTQLWNRELEYLAAWVHARHVWPMLPDPTKRLLILTRTVLMS